jgi:hypothetical protein
VDIFAVERGDERAVEPIDDRPCPLVAAVLDVLDGLSPGRVWRIARQHLLEHSGADADLLGQSDEVGVELFFFWNQAETNHGTSGEQGIVTDTKHIRHITVTCMSRAPAPSSAAYG